MDVIITIELPLSCTSGNVYEKFPCRGYQMQREVRSKSKETDTRLRKDLIDSEAGQKVNSLDKASLLDYI